MYSGQMIPAARLAALALCSLALSAQPVEIRVQAGTRLGKFEPIYSFFGYDEPNYTYMRHGPKLLGELAALSPVPVYIRAHNLLTSGDGTAALKWGSTNAYTEDAQGRPVYDWTIMDRIFDTYRDAGVVPLVEIGFMPEALSVKPQPYRHHFPDGGIAAGWAYPPKDYSKWAALVREWVRHAVARYGRAAVGTWYWEVWNEPNILYWQGSPEEYHKLYDYAAAAVKEALPAARIGGPHSTGPGDPKAAAFLRAFLEHCVRGKNYATGAKGAPLDYIGFHAKGRPQTVDGHVRMGIDKHLGDVARGFEIVASFPELGGKPVIIGESDPEGCAACSARSRPENAYRNGPLYACYTAAVFKQTLAAAREYGVNVRGMVTWAFEFEDQPYFDGFRTLATNGIDKPVLNVFRMLGMMGGDMLDTRSAGAAGLDALLADGARGRPDIDAIAARAGNRVSVLAWNYHADDAAAPAASVRLLVTGLPAGATRVLERHFRIDANHSNAYALWIEPGRPERPSEPEYARLERAGQLEMLGSPAWIPVHGGAVAREFTLPRQAVSLVEFSW
jgi:xylan 1,4-beta-xylosidase